MTNFFTFKVLYIQRTLDDHLFTFKILYIQRTLDVQFSHLQNTVNSTSVSCPIFPPLNVDKGFKADSQKLFPKLSKPSTKYLQQILTDGFQKSLKPSLETLTKALEQILKYGFQNSPSRLQRIYSRFSNMFSCL